MKSEIRWGLFAIGMVFLLVGSYSFNGVQRDYKYQCQDCIDQDCMDNDLICGYFGVYWVKFMILFTLIVFGIILTSNFGGYNNKWKSKKID